MGVFWEHRHVFNLVHATEKEVDVSGIAKDSVNLLLYRWLVKEMLKIH